MPDARSPHSEPVRYGLRCMELGDAPGEIHDFVLASDYDRLVEQLEARQQVIEHVWAWMQTVAAEEGSYVFALADEVQKFVVSNPASEPSDEDRLIQALDELDQSPPSYQDTSPAKSSDA